MTIDWQAIRAQFPALTNWTYLNSATFGQLPKAAIEAVCRHWAHRDELACSGIFLDWYGRCGPAPRIAGEADSFIR